MGQKLIGSTGKDKLQGGAGDDTLRGNDGNDTLIGGDGNDLLYGGANADVLRGADGSDTLNGGDGGDTLDGGAGTDSMIGGKGSDTYFVDSSSDVIVELAEDGGTDVVKASSTYTLPAAIENLVLTDSAFGSGATGNGSANRIVGNGYDNKLEGVGSGDTLVGGGGRDDFYFRNDSGDVIEDFVSGMDRLTFDVYRITHYSGNFNVQDWIRFPETADPNFDPFYNHHIEPTEFVSGAGVTTAGDADDRFIYDTESGKLYYDADGTGTEFGNVARILVATLVDAPALAYTDLTVTSSQQATINGAGAGLT